MKREHTILNSVENTIEKATEKTLTDSLMHIQKRVARKHREEPLIHISDSCAERSIS